MYNDIFGYSASGRWIWENKICKSNDRDLYDRRDLITLWIADKQEECSSVVYLLLVECVDERIFASQPNTL